MKILALEAALVVLFGPVASLGQDAAVKPICSEHPAVTREVVVEARNASHGIRQQHDLDLQSRPPGREVKPMVDPGGGDCPAESTPRGAAASAVGALLYNGAIHCSAVLVTPTMVLTAAHCIRGFDENKLEFVLGLDSERPVQRAGVYHADVNPQYDDQHFGVVDIGYAYLKYQMTEATPVQLPEDALPHPTNLSVLHVGYGIAGTKPGARRCVNIPVQEKCNDSFSYATTNMNTCNGDSGGGAFRDLGDQILLVGTTDWGDSLCAEFGVDVDAGYYLDWIQARKSQAPRNIAYARVEPSARKQLNASPDDVAKQVVGVYGGEAKFDSLYKGGWVTWDAKVDDIRPRNDDEIPGTCTVLATAGQGTHLMLRQYPDGCALVANTRIRFTGRLARIGTAGLDVVLAEPVTAQPQVASAAVGEYTLTRLTSDTREVRERRSREVRLESRHGSWSGRVTQCLPISIEAPWHLDRTVPVNFKPGYTNHGGYVGTVQGQNDQGFCVPLWAEGFGGTQAFGATLDAGMVGVVSGTVEFGVVKSETAVAKTSVAAGPITGADFLKIPLPSLDPYELHVKLANGKEQTFSDSGSVGGVTVNWADGKVVLKSEPKL